MVSSANATMQSFMVLQVLEKAQVATFRFEFSGLDAVDGMVWIVVQPLALLNGGVCRIRTWSEAESRHDVSFFIAAHIAAPQLHISFYRLP